MRIGRASGSTLTAATFIDELTVPTTPAGVLSLVQSIALPSDPPTVAGTFRLTMPSTIAHGFASLANDGSRIVVAGLNLPPNVNATAGLCEAVVGTVDAYGQTEVVTSLGSGAIPYAGGAVFSAASDDGTNFWTNGLVSGGVYHTTRGSTTAGSAALLDVNSAGWSHVLAQNGRLFALYSGNSAAIRYIVKNATTGGDLPTGGPLTYQLPAGAVITIGAAGSAPVGISGSLFRQFTFIGNDVLLITEATASVAGGLRIFRRQAGTGTIYNSTVFVQDLPVANGPAYR